jgi:RNA polymerase sigma factor for flagellar operon FliA
MSESTRLAAETAEDLWRRWKHEGDNRARDRLILSYAPMVRYIAIQKARAVFDRASLDDLVGAGLMLLVQAVDGFDPARGATFEQYAWTRVSGGMIDDLRKADWAPRSLRRAGRDIDAARSSLTAALGRRPTNAELAKRLDMTEPELVELLQGLARAEISSLNSSAMDGDEAGSEVIDTICGADATPEEATLADERSAVIRDAIRALSRREQLIVQKVYVEGLSARDVAGMIRVSESRVSQVTRDIREKLAARLTRYDAQAA